MKTFSSEYFPTLTGDECVLNIFYCSSPSSPSLPPSYESLIFGNNTVTYRRRVQWFWFATCQASLVLAVLGCETPLGHHSGSLFSFLTARPCQFITAIISTRIRWLNIWPLHDENLLSNLLSSPINDRIEVKIFTRIRIFVLVLVTNRTTVVPSSK